MRQNRAVPTNQCALLMEAGFVYRYARRLQEAREIFQTVLALQPLSELGEIGLAGVSFDEGRFDDAIVHCSNAIKLNPKSVLAHTQLAEAELLKGNVGAARRSIQRAIHLDSIGPGAAT